MANDDETLTFRLRAVAENMAAFGKAARGAEDVNLAMIKSRKTAEALTASNRKLTAARDKEADAAGRVRTAEAKLDEVRGKTNVKMSQIAAAEERVATARRNSSRATQDANRIEGDFNKAAEKALARSAEQAGENAGRRFHLGFGKFMKKNRGLDDEVENGSKIIGSTFGSGILSGLQAALRSQAGPAILAALVAVAAITAPAIGAVLAGGIVLAFGAGLAALAIVFAAKSEAVKTKWKSTITAMGAETAGIAKPFEAVLIHIADTMQKAFGRFAPILKEAFALGASPVQKFADEAIGALERFRPAILPVTNAFNALLKSLGPALQDAIGSIADGLIGLSDSVTRNPSGLPDFIKGIGELLQQLLHITQILNDANGAFERLTGGVSAVDAVFATLKFSIWLLLSPIIILANYIRVISSAVNALKHGTDASGQSMADAAASTVGLAQGLQATGGAASKAAPAIVSVADRAANAAKAAADAKKAFEDWISQLFRLSNLAQSLAGAQLSFHEAVTRATAAVKENGKATSQSTAAGQGNWKALLAVAAAAQQQTEQMIRSKVSMVTVAAESAKSRVAFVKLAIQMGFSSKAANKMATDMIAIPNVSREAKLTANKKDLEAKLRAAKASLNDKDLTKERKAQINANIAALQTKLRQAQAQIDALHGKTVEIKYTANGFNYQSPSLGVRKAGGGPIRGPGGDTSDRAGIFALSNKEWVIRAKASQKYGDYAMGSVNAGTATIIPGGMARGGPVVNFHTRGAFPSKKAGDAYLNGIAGGPALDWARSQVGKHYLWGGVGPSGYDCSGFLSAIVNVIRGQNPYHRLFSTGSLPGGMFARGRGRFNIGWFKGNPGHTAGTLNGVNVESSGFAGVRVGSSARGAGDSLFNSGIWHLKGYARGGRVGDPPYDGFGKWLQNLVPNFARGTSYVANDGLAYLHRGEAVTPSRANGPRNITVQLVLDGRVIQQSLLKLKHSNGGIDLGLT